MEKDWQREPERRECVTSSSVLDLVTHLRLVCCSMKLTAVVYYLFMNIHEVCY